MVFFNWCDFRPWFNFTDGLAAEPWTHGVGKCFACDVSTVTFERTPLGFNLHYPR